jgi:hypothetical protein
MSAQSTTIDTLTVCRICNQAIDLGVPIIGEQLEARATRLTDLLKAHVKAEHVNQAMMLKFMTQQFQQSMLNLLIVNCFATEDATLLLAYDAARAPIHALTRKSTLSDKQLHEIIVGATPPGPFSKGIVNAAMPLARKLRDILSEQGEYEHPVVKQARESAGKPVTA